MLLENKCSAVTSVAVHLRFDDNTTKDRVIAIGDLIEVEFNQNGLRKHIEGKVLRINCVGTDPKGWYIVVDGSDDFKSDQYRFSPAAILDCEIIRKFDTIKYIETTNDHTQILGLRIVKGRIQYTQDGFNWHCVNIDKRDIILDEEGTVPDNSGSSCCNKPSRPSYDDGIKDEVI